MSLKNCNDIIGNQTRDCLKQLRHRVAPASITDEWNISMGGLVVSVRRQKTEGLGENPDPVQIYLPQILHRVAAGRTQVSVVRFRRLTTSAMVWP